MLVRFFAIIFGMLTLAAFAGTGASPFTLVLQQNGTAPSFTLSNLTGAPNAAFPRLGISGNPTPDQVTGYANLNSSADSFTANVNIGSTLVGTLSGSADGAGDLNATFTPDMSQTYYNCGAVPTQQAFGGVPYSFTFSVACNVPTPPPPTTYGVTFSFSAGASGLTLANNTLQPSFSNVLWANPTSMSMDGNYNLSFTNSSANGGAAFINSADSNGHILNINLSDTNGTYVYPVLVTKTAGSDNLMMAPAGGASLPSGDNCTLTPPISNSDTNETYSLSCSQQTNTYSYDLQLQGNSGASNILAPTSLSNAAWSSTGAMSGSATDANDFTYTFSSTAATYGNGGSTNFTVNLKYANQTYALPVTLTKKASGTLTLTPQNQGNLPAGLTCAAGVMSAPSNTDFIVPLVCTYVAPVTIQNYNVTLSFTPTDGNTYGFIGSNASSVATQFPWSNSGSAVTPSFVANAYQYSVPTTAASLGNTTPTNTVSFPIAVNGSASGAKYFYNAQFANSVKDGVNNVSLLPTAGSQLPPRTTCNVAANTTNIVCVQAAEQPVQYTYSFSMTNSTGTTISDGTGLASTSTTPWTKIVEGAMGNAGNTYSYSFSATPTAYGNSAFSSPVTISLNGPAQGFNIAATLGKTANGSLTITPTNMPAGTNCTFGTISTADNQNYTIPVICNNYATQSYSDVFTLNSTGLGSTLKLASSPISTVSNVGWAYPNKMAIASSTYNLSFTNTSTNNGAAFKAESDSKTININLSDVNGNYVYPITIKKGVGDDQFTVVSASGSTLPSNYSCSVTASGSDTAQAYGLNCTYTANSATYAVNFTAPSGTNYAFGSTGPSATFANSVAGIVTPSYSSNSYAYAVRFNGSNAGASNVINLPLVGGAVSGTYYVAVNFVGSAAGSESMVVDNSSSKLPPDIASCAVNTTATNTFGVSCSRVPSANYTVSLKAGNYSFQADDASNLAVSFANSALGAVTPSYANGNYTYNVYYTGTSPGNSSKEVKFPLVVNGTTTNYSIGVNFVGGATESMTIDSSNLPPDLSNCQVTAGTFAITCAQSTTKSVVSFANNFVIPSAANALPAQTLSLISGSSSASGSAGSFVGNSPMPILSLGQSNSVGLLSFVNGDLNTTITFNGGYTIGSGPGADTFPLTFTWNLSNGFPGTVTIASTGSGAEPDMAALMQATVTSTSGGYVINLTYKHSSSRGKETHVKH